MTIHRHVPVKRRNPTRHAKNIARAHGTAAHRAWMQAQPCIVCGRTPSEGAHIRTGGVGRKADADQMVPLCGPWWERLELGLRLRGGHHAESHRGIKTFVVKYGLDLPAEAAKCYARWLAVSS